MTKRKAHLDKGQLSLLDLIEAAREAETAPSNEGSMDIADRLKRALSSALKETPLSVHQVAGEMSHLLGETITADMIYSWTADSKSQHQIWGSRLPAFCRATGSHHPIMILAEACGVYCLPGAEALRSEIHRLVEQERTIRRERSRRERFLAEIEQEALP